MTVPWHVERQHRAARNLSAAREKGEAGREVRREVRADRGTYITFRSGPIYQFYLNFGYVTSGKLARRNSFCLFGTRCMGKWREKRARGTAGDRERVGGVYIYVYVYTSSIDSRSVRDCEIERMPRFTSGNPSPSSRPPPLVGASHGIPTHTHIFSTKSLISPPWLIGEWHHPHTTQEAITSGWQRAQLIDLCCLYGEWKWEIARFIDDPSPRIVCLVGEIAHGNSRVFPVISLYDVTVVRARKRGEDSGRI